MHHKMSKMFVLFMIVSSIFLVYAQPNETAIETTAPADDDLTPSDTAMTEFEQVVWAYVTKMGEDVKEATDFITAQFTSLQKEYPINHVKQDLLDAYDRTHEQFAVKDAAAWRVPIEKL